MIPLLLILTLALFAPLLLPLVLWLGGMALGQQSALQATANPDPYGARDKKWLAARPRFSKMHDSLLSTPQVP